MARGLVASRAGHAPRQIRDKRCKGSDKLSVRTPRGSVPPIQQASECGRVGFGTSRIGDTLLSPSRYFWFRVCNRSSGSFEMDPAQLRSPPCDEPDRSLSPEQGAGFFAAPAMVRKNHHNKLIN